MITKVQSGDHTYEFDSRYRNNLYGKILTVGHAGWYRDEKPRRPRKGGKR